ncbi:molybdate ABC transporter substrate-binding protein [Marivivens sp.]|jgi:molybdate transport system substrate-binding protein|uniref:molybdate ABC transporter substrate-binding protein n=1 Tax=Marivivens sp. TaxID=1978374 RepID=UPI00201E76B5|nr:molybdate ABC transporter substrate-binding protein [Marivivens sp.]MCL7405167.1 molybdate ABC transporter substrate-binding protein [Marivivens geojensis]
MWRTLSLCTVMAAQTAAADTVVVFAAASTKTALDQIAAEFTQTTGHDVVLSYAGSSALARQITQGAPADIFISANIDWMDAVEAEGLIEDGSRRDLLGNRLVLIGSAESAASVELADLPEALGNERLAMGMVDSVPAGIYGKAALDTLGLWADIQPQVAQMDNVRSALALVALGEAPFGIVYATDALADPSVHVVADFPTDSYPAIVYPVADITGRDSEAENAFLDYLSSPAARALFEAQGFTVLN